MSKASPSEEVKVLDAAKEAAINEKIRLIRERNEKREMRYQEVENDRKNADIVSSTAKTSPPPRVDLKPKQPVPKRERPSKSEVPRVWVNERMAAKSNNEKPSHSFGEGDGPPPDPGYRFLADDERDEPKTEVKSNSSNAKEQQEISSWPEKPQNSASKGRGRRPQNRPQRPSPRSATNNESKSDQNWRQERAQIDEARIQRQKTADGNWRREWDNLKQDKDLDFDGPERQFGSRGGRSRFSNNGWEERQTHGNRKQKDAPRRRNNQSRTKIFNRNRDEHVPDEPASWRNKGHSEHPPPAARYTSSNSYDSTYRREHESPFETTPHVQPPASAPHADNSSRQVLLNGGSMRILLRSTSDSGSAPKNQMSDVSTCSNATQRIVSNYDEGRSYSSSSGKESLQSVQVQVSHQGGRITADDFNTVGELQNETFLALGKGKPVLSNIKRHVSRVSSHPASKVNDPDENDESWDSMSEED